MLATNSCVFYFSTTPDIAYFPSIDSDTDDFSFSINSNFGVFNVEAHWVSSLWKLYVTLPSGVIREATVFPGVLTWKEFTDYSLYFITPSYTEVLHDDLSSTVIRIFKR
jgi:hypothetical protein